MNSVWLRSIYGFLYTYVVPVRTRIPLLRYIGLAVVAVPGPRVNERQFLGYYGGNIEPHTQMMFCMLGTKVQAREYIGIGVCL